MHLIKKQMQDFLITLAEEQSSFINLFGTKGDTLIPLSFLDQILSAYFFFNYYFTTFVEVKIYINGVIASSLSLLKVTLRGLSR